MAKDIITTASDTANLESLSSTDFAVSIQKEQHPEASQLPPFFPKGGPNDSDMDELRSIARAKKEGYTRRAHRITIGLYPHGDPDNQYERDYTRFRRSFKRDVYNSNQELKEIGQSRGIPLGDIQALYIDADAILDKAAKPGRNSANQISLFEQLRH